MPRRIRLISVIIIIFMANILLFTLYKYTQSNYESEFKVEGEKKINLKNSKNVDNNAGQNLLIPDSTKENLDTDEKIALLQENKKEQENVKEPNEKHKENEKPLKDMKNMDYTYFLEKQKEFLENFKKKEKEKEKIKQKIQDEEDKKNGKKKEKEFKNGVDDSGEFRSLIPMYESFKKKNLLEEYYDVNMVSWKNIRFGEYVLPTLEGISNRTEYQIRKKMLMDDAVRSINYEQDKQNKRTSYDDERELRFLLKYARDVESGVRKDELEPEWQWAANISIVYTWVNGSDPIHLEEKSKYNGGIKKVDNRDRCVDELRYSLRSVFKNLPWHKGKIFIVTPGQTPNWLDPEFDRIQIVNQEDILPKKDIKGNDVNPTFNSFAIEWYLDKIPGVTEQFIQLNDDYFINHPIHPSYFFYGSGESYDIENDYIDYFNLENKLREDYPYFFFKFYKVSEHYQMTSKLSYNKYLEDPSQIQGYLYCLREIINHLNEGNKEEEEEEDADIEEKNSEKKVHSKRYEYKPRDKVFLFPNAAQHFRYPNLYLALHYLINDMQYARNVGRRPFSYTTMSERFSASLAMTNGGIKSIFGRYIRTNQLEHAPYVWYRDLFPMSRAKFQKFIDDTLTHKFRHPEDVIPTFANQAYLRYYASKRGFEEEFDQFHSSKYIYDTEEEAKERHSNRKIVKDRSVLKYGFHIVEDRLREKTMRFGQVFDDIKRNIKLYKDILTEPSLLFFNLNDDYTEPRVSEELHEFMNYLFPEKAEFEK
ncbi:hypothetical protein LY90DRAFT_665624 [Neocallimastix californiae]|uniref:Stealth protein CR2 conserved region 2 domain-containing protein n=1 Tax=Neocallimastix californiae TaxID=1754190 RepID=A0A1Y2EX18_9FUNG|nr:hypothetical protein LY90DRAFT_665624 [Neocallimastix californiae]|eukprot:ORY76108.1 hypothetical protein LY90DRAFT_665624 [Neocallimastix californiae]